MKNSLLTTLLLAFTAVVTAQVGVGTTTPDNSAALDVESSTQGFLPARMTFAEIKAIANPAEGLIIYCTDCSPEGIYLNEDPDFKHLPSGTTLQAPTTPMPASTEAVSTVQVGVGTTTPNNSAALDVESTTQGFLPPRMTFAEIAAIPNPAVSLIIYCTDCSPKGIYVNYNPDFKHLPSGTTLMSPIPVTITLGSNIRYFIASVKDTDHLPYVSPTGPATLATGVAADGTAEDYALNVQGVLTTTGVTIEIPYTATGDDTLPAFTQTVNVPAEYTEDGVARDVTFSYPETAYTATTTGSITATLKAVGGDLNLKQLDVQTGIGNDALGVLLANFTYVVNTAGDTADFQFRDIATIPDRAIADANHQMFYLPVVSETTGKTWLNNNLGANYVNANNANFNPTEQATALTDTNAYGSLYQWGRFSDGHEFRDSDVVDAISTTTTVAAPNTTKFLKQQTEPDANLFSTGNWYAGTNPEDLWQGEAGINNPCPAGFRVPTEAEFQAEIDGITTAQNYFEDTNLGFSFTGGRLHTTKYAILFPYFELNLDTRDFRGLYWTSTISSFTSSTNRSGVGAAKMFSIDTGFSGTGAIEKVHGLSVRCIKD